MYQRGGIKNLKITLLLLALCFVTLGCNINSESKSTPIDKNVSTPTPPDKVMFDDFNYLTSGDSNLAAHGWSVRSGSGGPGPNSCKWSRRNITFLTDSENINNKLMRLTARTSGSGADTSQAEILTSMKFFAGTYAARVKFSDTPISGSDGAGINQTFFTISHLDHDNDPKYSELDFEYLANGGWGVSGATMWNTSWYTYSNNPWKADNVSNHSNQSYAGWHSLVLVVADGKVTYYIDGIQVTQHGGKYYPRKKMAIDFNLWFLSEGPLKQSTYIQDVDWVYHAKDTVLTPAQVDSAVQNFRTQNITFKDTVN